MNESRAQLWYSKAMVRIEAGNRHPYWKAVAGLTALGLVAGCGNYGEPVIVSGVPAQVDYKEKKSEYDPSNPPLWPIVYYFGLEQCEADIEMTVDGGKVTDPSFNPEIRTYDEACFVRRMEVPREIYEKYEEGATITFEGTVGEPINRIG